MAQRTAIPGRPASPAGGDDTSRILDGGFWLVLVMAVVCGALVLLSVLQGGGSSAGSSSGGVGASSASGSPSPGASVDTATYLASVARPAPPIELTDQDGNPFALASLLGSPTFVFFGYTHCPDVCPATIGTVGEAMEAAGVPARAVFVSIDPGRDTPPWLKEYAKYLPRGFVALTGSETAVRVAADAWGVQYARVETGIPDGYSMSHTATVFLVDADGTLRASFPFGTGPDAMTAVLRAVTANPIAVAPSAAAATPSSGPIPPPSTSAAAVSPAPSAAPARPAAALDVKVVSTSVWAGPPSPVILALSAGGTRINDPGLRPTVQLVSHARDPVGAAVEAVPVQPPGVPEVSYVATIAIPQSGLWHLDVVAPLANLRGQGSADVTALDPGATAAIGAPAPTAHTPTLADVGGIARAVTTDPAPDLRLSQRSTTDALADHQPFVLVVDSTKFRVSPACGRAIIMARYLVDRWPSVRFIHLEPYRYSVITDTPVLDGSIIDPVLTDAAAAWGVGGDPWGDRSMPWTFVVDGNGIVRAKYQGVMGSDDVDVIVSQIQAGG